MSNIVWVQQRDLRGDGGLGGIVRRRTDHEVNNLLFVICEINYLHLFYAFNNNFFKIEINLGVTIAALQFAPYISNWITLLHIVFCETHRFYSNWKYLMNLWKNLWLCTLDVHRKLCLKLYIVSKELKYWKNEKRYKWRKYYVSLRM